MSEDFKTLEEVGPGRVMSGRKYFPTLFTDYSKSPEGIKIHSLSFHYHISKDTSRDAEPDFSTSSNSPTIPANKTLDKVVLRALSDRAYEQAKGWMPNVSERSFYEMFLPLWNSSRKKLEKNSR
jgi:hypothetical protein